VVNFWQFLGSFGYLVDENQKRDFEKGVNQPLRQAIKFWIDAEKGPH
jgi:hypothetical protein